MLPYQQTIRFPAAYGHLSCASFATTESSRLHERKSKRRGLLLKYELAGRTNIYAAARFP